MARLAESIADPLERLFDSALVMLGTASEGYFTRLNPCWERTLGWTNEQLMAEPFASFVHPEDVDATKEQASLLVGLGGAEVVGFENRYRRSDGVYLPISWTVSGIDGVMHFAARDISERRALDLSSARAAGVTKAIIQSVADGLYVVDSHRRLTIINPAGVRLLGYESAEELIGRSPHHTFHHTFPDGATYPIEDCPLAKVHLTEEPVRIEEDGFWRRDGSFLAVSYSSAPIELDDGTGSVVAFREITERKASELRIHHELEALCWVGRIRDALEEDRLVLYAQPIIDLQSGDTLLHELLARIVAPDGEIIPPGRFLPVAEEHGLMGEIDRRVFELATRYAAAGQRIAVNISADSISEPGLFAFVEDRLAACGVDPRLVVFEITETALIHNEGVAQVFIENVRRLGCAVALDDFGTGYGSFRYLKHLPVSMLKIDQDFVRDLEGETSEVNRHVIEAIVTPARGMGQKTVAEGVESETTLAMLRELSVDYAQGYLIARPTPADHALRSIEQRADQQ